MVYASLFIMNGTQQNMERFSSYCIVQIIHIPAYDVCSHATIYFCNQPLPERTEVYIYICTGISFHPLSRTIRARDSPIFIFLALIRAQVPDGGWGGVARAASWIAQILHISSRPTAASLALHRVLSEPYRKAIFAKCFIRSAITHPKARYC